MAEFRAIREDRVPAAMLGPMLNAARMRRGWRLREAARRLGLPSTYLVDVEAGLCLPSRAVAELLADGLQLDQAERAQLLGEDQAEAARRAA